jgi:hypothetical protein
VDDIACSSNPNKPRLRRDDALGIPFPVRFSDRVTSAERYRAILDEHRREALDEAIGGKRYDFVLASVAIILRGKSDEAVSQSEQAAIGNSAAVRVSAEVIDDVMRATEGQSKGCEWR